MIRALFFAAGSVVYGFAADFEYSRSRSVRKYNSRAISKQNRRLSRLSARCASPSYFDASSAGASVRTADMKVSFWEMASGRIFVLYSFCIAARSSVTACVRSLRV